MATNEVTIPLKKVLKDMKVTVKIIGLTSVKIRLKIASWLVALGCWVGNLEFIKQTDERADSNCQK